MSNLDWKEKYRGLRLGRKWERKGEGVKKTPEVIKGQKGLKSICYFNIQISKERYPFLLSLIPCETDVPRFDA